MVQPDSLNVGYIDVPKMQMLTLLKSQKTEDFETITRFPASIGACPSLGADKLRLSLLAIC